MLQIEVTLELPLKIAAGLASGRLELVGGVVREVGNKRIVMWLREGAKIADNSNLAGGVLRSLSDVGTGGLTGVAFGALDTVVSAHRHYQIMQQFNALTNLVSMVGGIGLLNLAATAASTALVLKRLNDLEEAIEKLGTNIAKLFAAARKVKMDSAINAANLALTMEGIKHRQTQASLAISQLYTARQQVWLEIDALKGTSNSPQNNILMQKNLEQAMRLDTLYCRCLMELENTSPAKSFLESNLQDYRESSRDLVHRHLGEHRAAYFHHSVLECDLQRYIAIEYWLRADGNRLLQILLGNRRDFWNNDVADNKGVKKPGRQRYIDALTQSELLIENLRRLEGFHTEIEAIERLGITYAELEKQQEEALAQAEKNLAGFSNIEEHDDYVLLVDKEWLAEQSDPSVVAQ